MPFPGPPPRLPDRNPTGVYRRTFTVPAGWDGQRIILTRTPDVSRPREVRVVLNWVSELERMAGPGGGG